MARAHGSQAQNVEKDHGRIEERSALALPVETLLGGLRGLAAWPGLRSLCVVESRRQPAATANVPASAGAPARRCFLRSLAPDAARLRAAVRGHWAIENKLY